MDEKILANLQQFEKIFQHACQVADPLDYQIRQRNLLYTISNFLLLPLMEYREEKKKKDAEANPTPISDIQTEANPNG